MTESNYNYRTAPLFLRNQFPKAGSYGIPVVPKPDVYASDFDNLRLIGFDKIRSDKGRHANRIVHFFLYDYKFERVWEKPDGDLSDLQKYRAVLTPDFSMYTEMPEAMLLYNVFRNRWCGAYLASKGLRVIPTVNFGLKGSFDFCFEGIEKGSAVALSTYMVQEKEGREAQKDFFLACYNEMIRRIEPETIICYHEPFPEMTGNIVYVNYDLSSWQHMDDDIQPENRKQAAYAPEQRLNTDFGAYMIPAQSFEPAENNDVYRVGSASWQVQMGAGSAYGGKWVPKDADAARYLGEPGDINRVDYRETKIGSDGRATMERHNTGHANPKAHSNPHDHKIEWVEDGSPRPGSPINYWDGNAPTFKLYRGELNMIKVFRKNTPEENAFTSIADFQTSMRRNAEVEFIYEGRTYGITHPIEGKTLFFEAYKDDTDVCFDSSEDLLNHVIGGKKLREIITQVTVTDRTI